MNIHIEGNIGAGKSTLLEFLKKEIKCNISQEPVEEWIDLNLLENFYGDIERWSFTFQMNCFISRSQKIKELPNKEINIIERSILSDRIFAQNCFNSGKMTEMEHKIYLRWSSWLYKEICKPIKNIIYLRSTPVISHERIKQRDRDSEKEIPLEYLEQLHSLHDEWLSPNRDDDLNIMYLNADDLKYDKVLAERIKTHFNLPNNHF
jgi:deoxyadenosine/deoxycytidine kinase